ncbi:hypothetical protein Q7P37_010060 [Cladosporium fusiforme]
MWNERRLVAGQVGAATPQPICRWLAACSMTGTTRKLLPPTAQRATRSAPATMSHLETPFHPGPFAGQHQHTPTPHHQHHQQQQQQQQQQQHHQPQPHQPHDYQPAFPQAQATTPPQPSPHHQQAFAPAPYPGHAATNTHPRPPNPPFHDGLMHQPNHFPPAASFAGQQFTSAPFAQNVTSTSASPTPPLQQQSGLRHSASPQQLNSPYALPQHQFQQQQQPQHLHAKQQTPPTKYPMAAPPLPQTPATAQQTSGGNAASPHAPQSPGTQAREQKRVELLLEINGELLQEINTLQSQGRGGAMNPQHQLQLRALNMDESMAAEEYIQCLRRVQANLAYLAPRADAHQAQKAPPGPAHMSPPAHMPQLQPRYEQLRELFPGWPGLDNRMTQSAAGSPRTSQTNQINPQMNPQMNPMNGMNPQASATPMAQI